ncbi:DUF5711 family protein [Eubacteriales bacterium OttesenSCG-928-A19]|nr:DUF5711 family protein [Eubacteriales bacterium OttesenSCG-928-A19]
MQRNKPSPGRKNPYVRSGVAGHNTPGGRKRSSLPTILRVAALLILLIGVIVGLAVGLPRLASQSSKTVRINARPSDNIQAFGESVLYYDGMTLYCVDSTGSSQWAYSLGTGGDYMCTSTMVAAWTGNQIVVLNKSGQPTYADRVEDVIRFARVGESYVAVCFGSDDLNARVRVMSHTGHLLENFVFSDLYLLDIGFFYTREQLMWVLGLDINGSTPSTMLSTYEPGRMSTGAVELQDELVYCVYPHNNNLMVVDTSKIRTYNYKCVEQTDLASMLTYGWQVHQTKTIGRNTYALLEQMPQSGNASDFYELRLATNYSMQSLRMTSSCFASGLSEKGIYGFGENVIYYAPYGSITFKATPLNFAISELICMLGGGRAVFVYGDDVIIMTLPT